MAHIEEARRWREETGRVGTGGVVVLFDGQVAGWMNKLRDPGHWEPGCIAVDENGHSWTTIAGDAQNGTLMWLPNEPL